MTSAIWRRNFGSGFTFLVLTVITWFLFFSLSSSSEGLQPGGAGLFILGAGLFSFIILKAIGYFSDFRLLPRKSDLSLAVFAFPLGALLQNTLIHSFTGIWVIPLGLSLFVQTFLLALIVFGGHYLVLSAILRRRKHRVVLIVSEAERVKMVKVFDEMTMTPHLEFLSIVELKSFVLQGRESEIDFIVISQSMGRDFDPDGTLIRAHLEGIPIVDYQQMVTDLSGRVSIAETDLWSYLVSAVPHTPLRRFFFFIKDLAEPVIGAIVLAVALPLMLVIAFVIRRTSEGPVIYGQVRTGLHGKNFTLYKFRSMRHDAEANGPQWASSNDSRVTPVGAFLRKTRLDELPQLWNVARGEMSFCGPRPERPEIYLRLKRDIPLFALRTMVRPGITGWAQVRGGYAATVEESLAKLEYDLFYIKNLSPRIDLIILIETFVMILFGNRSNFVTEREMRNGTNEIAEQTVAS